MSDIELLEALARNEELLSGLYSAFAAQFPARAGLWERLSAQETGHAAIIRALYIKVRDGSLKIQPERFSREAIALTAGYIKQLATGAADKDLVWAFSVAMDIEKSMLEHEFFGVFEADSQELKIVLNKLAEDTRRHFGMIEEAWKEFKANQ